MQFKMKNVLFFLLVIIIAFIGVVSGSWFINWRNSDVDAANLNYQVPVISTKFSLDEPFPELELLNKNGNPVSTTEMLSGKHSVILFISPGCDPCEVAINYWKPFKNDIPSGYQIIGLCEGEFAFSKAYIEEHDFPYPVFYDTGFVFSYDYDIIQFPNVMGINASGNIAFLNRGLYGKFTPMDACDLIVQ